MRLAIGTMMVLGLAVPGHAAEPLPNLVPRVPARIVVGAADHGTGTSALRFDFGSLNASPYALDVLGLEPAGEGKQAAAQCVAWAGRVCTERRVVGEFVFHADHQHWHLEEYALYELRTLLPDGTPDLSATGLRASSGKVSFCLMDVSRRRDPRPPAEDPFDRTGFYRTCSGFLQGISPGWDDVYGAHLEGQQVVIDGIPDGSYALVTTVNPSGLLLETDHADNTSWTAIRLIDGRAEPIY